MAAFDEIVTDPAIRLADVRTHVGGLRGDELHLGRYRVTCTSGSSGEPGIFVSDLEEWATIASSYWRAWDWAGYVADPLRPERVATTISSVPWHQSTRLAVSAAATDLMRCFDAGAPLDEILEGLNDWQPDNISTYASIARALAEEQIRGRLSIAPRRVLCGGDALTDDTRARIAEAWGCEPFDVYGATEAGVIAAECAQHRIHLADDQVIVEIVDERNRLVPPGAAGDKVLVTVLFSRTMPLIRYELSDRVIRAASECPCGRPFGVIGGVLGRQEDTLRLPGRASAAVAIRRHVFHGVLGRLPVHAWQVWREHEGLRVLLARPAAPLDIDAVARAVTKALEYHGAAPLRVDVQLVETVAKTPSGKAPLIRDLTEAEGSAPCGPPTCVPAVRSEVAGAPSARSFRRSP